MYPVRKLSPREALPTPAVTVTPHSLRVWHQFQAFLGHCGKDASRANMWESICSDQVAFRDENALTDS